MNYRNQKLTREIISSFHGKRFSGRVRKNFHAWLISPEDFTAKDEVMAELWNSITVPADRSAYRSLRQVKI